MLSVLLVVVGLAVTPPDHSPLPQPVNFKCGLKPLPPLGCDSDNAVCVCDRNGNCSWQFQC